MTELHASEGARERAAVLEYVQYQRASVRSVVADLAEADWHRVVVPSGWTVAGLVAHLGDMERHWLQGVLEDDHSEQPWDELLPQSEPGEPFRLDGRPSSDALGYYQDQTDRSDAIIARHTLDDMPLGRHRRSTDDEELLDLRAILLHVIEETACHAGHLDLARELLDGGTQRGLR